MEGGLPAVCCTLVALYQLWTDLEQPRGPLPSPEFGRCKGGFKLPFYPPYFTTTRFLCPVQERAMENLACRVTIMKNVLSEHYWTGVVFQAII